MIRLGRRSTAWAAVACLAALALAGCGADGTSGITTASTTSSNMPPTTNNTPAVSGTVYAPGGQFAAAGRWWQWADALSLLPRAYALQGVAHITSATNVSLSRLDPGEAAHGSTDRAQLLANEFTDPATGAYRVANAAAANLDAGRLIVMVGGGDLLTRAFVFSPTTDIDAVSEAVVRLVLTRLTQPPVLQLKDFTSDGLKYVHCYAQLLARDISGNSVAEINDNAYSSLAASSTMQDAVDCVAGMPSKCKSNSCTPPLG